MPNTVTLSTTVTKTGETSLTLKIERVTINYSRMVKPIGLPRLQTQSSPIANPVVVAYDIGFMTRTVTLEGNCTDVELKAIRDAALNWYRSTSTTQITFASLVLKEITFTGLLGKTQFTKNDRDSQVTWSYVMNFHIQSN